MNNTAQDPQSNQPDSNDGYKPMTFRRILEIVEETKDLTRQEQSDVACSMPMTACGIYVLTMESKYGISVAV